MDMYIVFAEPTTFKYIYFVFVAKLLYFIAYKKHWIRENEREERDLCQLWRTIICNLGWNQTGFEIPVFLNPGNTPIAHIQIYWLLESLRAHGWPSFSRENRFAKVTKMSFVATRHQYMLDMILARGQQVSLLSLSFSHRLRDRC